jgi:hypothetical protein
VLATSIGIQVEAKADVRAVVLGEDRFRRIHEELGGHFLPVILVVGFERIGLEVQLLEAVGCVEPGSASLLGRRLGLLGLGME